MAFWVHVEKGYTIFIVYFSSFKSLESLESLARLLKKVSKSCETFKIQDFANANLFILLPVPTHQNCQIHHKSCMANRFVTLGREQSVLRECHFI